MIEAATASRARVRPLRVVVTVPWGDRLGGAENFLWTFLRHADRRHVRATVVFLHPGPFQQEVAGLGIETMVIPAGRLRQIGSLARTIGSLTRLLRSTDPDLVVNWSTKTQLYGGMAACLAGMRERVVWWQHGIPNGHWVDRLATMLPSRAVFCCSATAKRAQAAHRPHRPTVLIYPGIDSPASLPVTELASLRSRLRIPADRLVIGIVGRLQPWKGQDVFLRALASLRDRGCPVHGLVVGGNAYDLSPGFERELHQLARSLDLQGAVSFTGQVTEPAPYVQLMDISVSASACEPFGLVVLEAMAAGVPVVAYDGGGPAEIIEAEQSGLLVPAGDQRALAAALERLIGDAELRRRIGRTGRKRVEGRFSAAHMTREIVHHFHSLCLN